MALERDDDDPIGVALREIERLHGVNVGLRAERDRLRADVAELVGVLAECVELLTFLEPEVRGGYSPDGTLSNARAVLAKHQPKEPQS